MEIYSCKHCKGERVQVKRDRGRKYKVICNKCFARGPIGYSREEAIIAWNNTELEEIKSRFEQFKGKLRATVNLPGITLEELKRLIKEELDK